MAKFYYGGQAVIEGVMMRGQRHMAVAVRAPGGTIVVQQEALSAAIYRHPAMKLPFLRGLTALWDALGLGMKALMFSANVALEEEEDGKAKTGGESQGHSVARELQAAEATTALPFAAIGVPDGNQSGTAQSKFADPKSKIENRGAFSGPVAWTSIAISLGLMIAIFFVLPVLAAGLITSLAGTKSSLAQNLVEGGIRLALFVGYIWAIGFMPDIKRVFGYHGAEHKTINAYEAGVELTPERVQSFTLLNPRCGTTFLLIVLVLATVLFVLLGKPPFILLVLSRIVLVPVVAAFSFEFIRLMANLYDHPVVRTVMAPGLALQKMTTRPPDLSMIEVGIAALNAVLVADGLVQPAKSAPVPVQSAVEEPAGTLA